MRRPRAFWISICNIIGLLFSLTGVVLLFWYALPNAAPGGPNALAISGGGPAWEAENRRYTRNAYIGLFLVIAGTLMEAVPPLCTAIGSARRGASVPQQAAINRRVRRLPNFSMLFKVPPKPRISQDDLKQFLEQADSDTVRTFLYNAMSNPDGLTETQKRIRVESPERQSAVAWLKWKTAVDERREKITTFAALAAAFIAFVAAFISLFAWILPRR